MRSGPGGRWLWSLLAVALTGLPTTVAAQSPTTPAHPSLPWSGITTPQGQMLRNVWVPPRPVVLEYVVEGPPPTVEGSPPPAEPSPAGETKADATPPAEATPVAATPSLQVVRQQVTIPGFYVRETTVGYHYPERWTIEQAGPNVYRWRMLPAQFVPR
jgi:hypothetical protein